MGQGSVRRISLGVFCMAPTQGYHHNQMQVGNVRKSRPSRTGIRVQPEAHLLLDYENQHWDKHVESNWMRCLDTGSMSDPRNGDITLKTA